MMSQPENVKFFPGHPADSLQTGEQFLEFKTPQFFNRKSVEKLHLIFRVIDIIKILLYAQSLK
jgi:hypothetical protein